jgi:glycosyltransferase involved in cell wall biosynthesis
LTPRVLFVGRGRIAVPLAPWLAKKWDALARELDLRVLNAGSGGGDPRFRLLPGSAAGFYPRLPFAIARELRSFRPQVVIASDPFVGVAARIGRALARSDAKLVVEVHGDPWTFTRAYGSRSRRLVARLADAAARSGIRRADATRALSHFTSSIVEQVTGRPATACFPTWSDLGAYDDTQPVPIPDARRVVFVGALERYKNVDGLAAAWRRVARTLPDATLVVIGDGSRRAVVDALVSELPRNVVHHPRLAPEQVASELDAARALVLPSWPEGLGRVVLEAFARGRAVVGTDGGGIPDMATHDRDALLVAPFDTDGLAAALERVLRDDELARRLGAAARETYDEWRQDENDFAAAYRSLVDRVLAGER